MKTLTGNQLNRRIKKRIKTIFRKYGDADTAVYTRDEWDESPKHSDHGDDAIVLAVYEGIVNHTINGHASHSARIAITDRLNTMLAEYDCYLRYCNHWSFAVFKKAN
jgi:hypothetical protein